MESLKINTETLIGEVYEDVFDYVLENRYTYYNLKGGRGSLKSSFISIMFILLILQNPKIHGVIYRKTASTLATSVYSQIEWAISALGLSSAFKFTKNPLNISYIKTGQQILFRGLDDSRKQKSIKVPFGYIGECWFEELDEFTSSEEIRKVQQSVLRGGDKFWVFKSMNPPKSNMNWANEYMESESFRDDTYTMSTTYLDAPPEWLGEQFVDDAEWLKQLNEEAYRHEYLGEITGTGTDVFTNIKLEEIESDTFDNIYMGIDWGWYPDPFRWVKCYYRAASRELFIFDEFSASRMSNEDTARALVEQKGVLPTDIIVCDSAEPKSIGDYRVYGLSARGAKKGAGSVNAGLKWLQSLNAIIIDPVKCPKTSDEFCHAEYDVNKDGEVMSYIEDKNNHSIDAVRYATERIWKRRGN